tara:strand:- start:13286 stop:13609 length:324 start_codon:yes stop_codon:yes gene_type:complete
MNGCSDMELIMEMYDGADTNLHNDTIESEQPPSYYEGKALHILKQLKDETNYFHFLNTIINDYSKLSVEHKDQIKKKMNIEPKVVIKEKVIYEKKKKKNLKPKLNNY